MVELKKKSRERVTQNSGSWFLLGRERRRKGEREVRGEGGETDTEREREAIPEGKLN